MSTLHWQKLSAWVSLPSQWLIPTAILLRLTSLFLLMMMLQNLLLSLRNYLTAAIMEGLQERATAKENEEETTEEVNETMTWP